MRKGIYALVFNGTDKVYIGQSINIEKRYTEHLRDLRDGTSSPKLLEAFKKYGKPSLEVLIECSTSELDYNEEELIKEFDSVDNGFNTLYKPGNPLIRGVDSVHAKLDKSIYINIFKELISGSTIEAISSKYNVSKHIVAHIKIGRTHLWLKDEFPEEYRVLEDSISKNKHLVKNRLLKNKLTGEIVEVSNITEFCSSRGLERANISRMINGGRKSANGWILYDPS